MSTGTGFTAAVTLLDVADNAQAPMSPSLHDDNGDGYQDFLWHDVPTRQVRVKRWSPAHGAFETGAPTRVRSASGKDDESYLTLDVNGDGTYETTGSRTSSFTYYTTETSQKGLLHTEVRDTVMEGAKVKIPAHTTTYAYDTFGNRVQARVQAASGSGANSSTETRCNHDTLAYDTYGRFVVKEKDCLGRLVRRLSRYNAHGLPIRTERVINSNPLRTVSTTYSYTAGGRLYFSHGADGSYTGTAWKDCDANCPTGAAYYIETRQAGGGESREFRDALGRAVRSAVQGFDGTWIHTDTEYDHLGRVARRSEPYYAGAVTQYWTRYEYDLLGRVTRTTLPDYDAGATNSLITVRYDGLATTTTNGKGQRQVQTRNALDETIRTADHTGTTVIHTYNTWGQVTGTRTSGTGVDAVTVAMAYDGLGRVRQVFDAARAGATWDDNVVEVQYNGQGYAYRWVDGVQVNNTSRKTYREITSRDARGTVTGEKLGGGAIHTRRVFDAKTGRIRSITGEDVLGRAVQALTYEWDLVGNLTVRGGPLPHPAHGCGAHGQRHEHDDDALLKQRGEGHRPGRQLHV